MQEVRHAGAALCIITRYVGGPREPRWSAPEDVQGAQTVRAVRGWGLWLSAKWPACGGAAAVRWIGMVLCTRLSGCTQAHGRTPCVFAARRSATKAAKEGQTELARCLPGGGTERLNAVQCSRPCKQRDSDESRYGSGSCSHSRDVFDRGLRAVRVRSPRNDPRSAATQFSRRPMQVCDQVSASSSSASRRCKVAAGCVAACTALSRAIDTCV